MNPVRDHISTLNHSRSAFFSNGMKKYVFLLVLLPFLYTPHAQAASKFEVTGWIPYWRAATGTQEALKHLDVLTEVNPFGFTVKKDGELADTLKIDEEPWPSFFAAARARGVKIIPTIMWSDSNAMDVVLNNKILRDAEIKDIVAMVQKYNFDGVDIDYEAKPLNTRSGFSTFLKDLYAAMGKKLVECDIEPRTPVQSLFDTVPKDFSEAYHVNDFVAINKYCDRVRIMAYDQRNVDVKLNAMYPGPYQPVADKEWVEKVIKLALKNISKNKIHLGVATYGYEYQLSGMSGSYRYKLLWAFNPRYATDLAQSLGVTPQRNVAGELSFMTLDNHILWWSDAQAIGEKVALAHQYGLRGVSIFKIDGGADPGLWNLFK